MTEEIWKPIKNYEGLYEVSNHGRVRSLDRWRISGRYKCAMLYKGRILKPGKNAVGYLKVDLSKNGKQKTCRVNRLVLAAFVGSSDLEGNHIDGDKENNKLENLEYLTCSENHKHAYRIGLASREGEKHHLAKLNGAIIENIRENRYKLTAKELAACYDVCTATIYNIIRRQSWQCV